MSMVRVFPMLPHSKFHVWKSLYTWIMDNHPSLMFQHLLTADLLRCGERTSIQIDCSASVSQNSQASRATASLLSLVLKSIYCNRKYDDTHTTVLPTTPYLNYGMHMRVKVISTHFQEHHQCSTNILTNLIILISRRFKQSLLLNNQ